MPTMKSSTSIPANATVTNVLDGQDYQLLPFDALGDLYVSQSATGLELEFKLTATSLASGITPNIAAAAGRVQQDTDAIFRGEPMPAGKQLKLTFRNTTAGALTANWWVELTQVGPG